MSLSRHLKVISVFFVVLCGLAFSPSAGQKYFKTSRKPEKNLTKETNIRADFILRKSEAQYGPCAGRGLIEIFGDPAKAFINRLRINPKYRVELIAGDDTYLIQLANKVGNTKDLIDSIEKDRLIFSQLSQKTKCALLPQSAANTQLNDPDLESTFLLNSDYVLTVPDRAPTDTGIDPPYDHWGRDAIGAPEVWGHVSGDSEIVVAVLDSGIDLKNFSKDDLWSAPMDINVSTGNYTLNCKAGTHGFNFRSTDDAGKCIPNDVSGHGTKVAGIIGADLEGIGVAKNVRILPIKILDKSYDVGCASDLIRAWDLIHRINGLYEQKGRKERIVIANNSNGFELNSDNLDVEIDFIKRRINEAGGNGLLIVSAAGNAKKDIAPVLANASKIPSPFYPASIASDFLISVAAVDRKDNLSNGCGGSSFGGTIVSLSAPGTGILTTTLGGDPGRFGCTSAATPFVSGAAALLLSVCPGLKNTEIKSVLLEGARKPVGFSNITQSGSLNILGAIDVARNRFPDRCKIVAPSP